MQVIGNTWSLEETLFPVSFYASNAPKQEMAKDIRDAVAKDLNFELPPNYVKGAGDTYFSGKMLAKLARILLIADESGARHSRATKAAFENALTRLRENTEIWLNGSAVTPVLYDADWGGIVTCGCYFNGEQQSCDNRYPDCPALYDMGQNFGVGFYNDHHFHFGYHIYAAAVISHFDHAWANKYFENVLLYIRDIANPSLYDPYFTQWRHKDWFEN